MRVRAVAVATVLASLACGGTGPAGPNHDLTGLSGTWCHKDGFCYTYQGNTITEENSGLKGTWHQEGEQYISQFGDDVPWVAKIEDYTPTTLVLTPYDDNVRIVYSKR